MRLSGLLFALVMAAVPAGAQGFLNCHFVPGWEPSGTVRQYNADNLFEYKDGGAEGYLSFGFVRMTGITCASSGKTLDIDVSEMGDADSAYGMFAANMDTNQPVTKIGMGGQVQKQSATFAKGKYYVELVEVADDPESDDSAGLRAFAAKMLEQLEGRETPPEALDWFPKENLASTRLVPESVLGLRELKHGYVAKYEKGQAFLVQEESPEAAAVVMKTLLARFAGAATIALGDEAFQTSAKYLDGICIFRKGRMIGGFANLPTAEDAAAQATKLAARIP